MIQVFGGNIQYLTMTAGETYPGISCINPSRPNFSIPIFFHTLPNKDAIFWRKSPIFSDTENSFLDSQAAQAAAATAAEAILLGMVISS